MSEPRLLDRKMVNESFRRLAVRLKRRGIVGNIYVFGGGAMVLAFDARKATRDIDARLTSSSEIQQEIFGVADELGLPRHWLNQQATVYVTRVDEPHPDLLFDHPNLRVGRVSDRHLLAMKAAAARRNTDDIGDLRLLADRLGLTSPSEVVRIHDEVLPDEPLPPRKLEVIREVFSQLPAEAELLDVGAAVGETDKPAATSGSRGPVRCQVQNKDGSRCRNELLPGSSCPAHGWRAPR